MANGRKIFVTEIPETLSQGEVENEALRELVIELANNLNKLLGLHSAETLTGPGQIQYDAMQALMKAKPFLRVAHIQLEFHL